MKSLRYLGFRFRFRLSALRLHLQPASLDLQRSIFLSALTLEGDCKVALKEFKKAVAELPAKMQGKITDAYETDQ